MTAPTGIEREPPVPSPVATRSVSPCTTLMRDERHVEILRDDLRIGRLVPLPVRLRADQHGEVARFRRGSPSRSRRRPRRCIRYSSQIPMPRIRPRRARRFGALLETRVVGLRKAALQRLLELADVVGAARSACDRASATASRDCARGSRRARGRLARAAVDEPLEHIGRLRPSRAAIGVDRHGVGVDAAHTRMERAMS